ncbi:mycothiol synthase [Kineosporia babensis]|uniref:Mycothiol acetyltransferase n=1 Tax=Kineosporia babensis TaxID=499548 RepID=A0A9X1SRL3_9ACTN|nr:mycothiol synthase [Kineosporia babensis]
MTSRVKIDVLDQLSETDAQAVHAVLDAATAADAVAPVSEQVLLAMGAAVPGGRHLVVREESGAVIGYAHTEDAEPEEQRTVVGAEAVIAPEHRGQGIGRELLEKITEGSTLARIWSHGDHPAARALGAQLGYRVVRELLQLRRPTNGLDGLPDPVLPEGVQLRTFRPGADDAAWLRVNSRAFSWHPEQGRMTQADLDARKAEPWFDPAGFFLAEADGEVIGFHWTKVHPEGHGEVYVVGVDPDRHGGGLGTALTLAGLRHLAGLGLPAVTLYVEADNAAALKVYHRLGFGQFAIDVVHEGPYPASAQH